MKREDSIQLPLIPLLPLLLLLTITTTSSMLHTHPYRLLGDPDLRLAPGHVEGSGVYIYITLLPLTLTHQNKIK